MSSQTLNGSQLTLTALQESDQEAFKRLLSTLLKANIDPSAFVYSGVVTDPTDSEYAKLSCSIAREKAHISLWPYQDSQTLKYKRVGLPALKDMLGGTVRADLPTTVREMMSIYLTGAGLHDRSDQFQDTAVTGFGAVQVSVSPEQFLIYGATTLTLKPKQRQLPIVLPILEIPGFRELSDFSLDWKRVLIADLDEVNATTLPYNLELEWLSFDTPKKISGYRYNNTTISMTSFGEGYYLGTVDVTYTRYDFGWATEGSQFLVQGPEIPTTQYMLSKVAAITGFPLTVEDVILTTYPKVTKGGLSTLTIVFKENNLRYTGELTIDYKAV